MNQNEEWKWITGHEGKYMVSNCGRIKSYIKHPQGKILSLNDSKGGYFRITLKGTTYLVHRLVAEAFIGHIFPGIQVHHKDANRQNNTVDNLTLVTAKEHRKETLVSSPQINLGMIKYNKEIRPKRVCQYDLSGKYLATYTNAKETSSNTGVCHRNILQVASKTPFNKFGRIRRQAGGYVWKFENEREVMMCED